jgi:polar amino acid transport system permease protein
MDIRQLWATEDSALSPPAPRLIDRGLAGLAAGHERFERSALSLSFRTRVRLATLALTAILVGVFLQFPFDYRFTRTWIPFILEGIPLTLLVATAAMALAIVLALFGALGRLSKRALPYSISSFYVSFVRGTPLLVQLFLWYAALPQLAPSVPSWVHVLVVLPAMVAGILALGCNYGAYMTEIFRAGFQSIGHGQLDAAYAVGMSYGQATRRVLLPQAIRVITPAIGNEYISMLKDSSLVGLITVEEVFYRANEVGTEYFKNLEMLSVAAVIYWTLTIIFSAFQARLERRMRRAYDRS